MSKRRQSAQTAIYDPQGRAGSQLTALSYDYISGHEVVEHFHREDQLVFACKGVMTIRTNEGVWIVPPQRAVWIPDGIAHSIRMAGGVSMRTLYFAQKFVKALPRHCFVMNVSPLLRELILHACISAKLTTKVAKEKRVIELIIDQLDSHNMIPLQLQLPTDQRAKRIADVLIANPGDRRLLEELCEESGASKRTIERLFQEQTLLTFGKWRQQLRILHSIPMLASGDKVINVALEAGYNSPSAYISAFRKVLGTTPSHYCEGEMRSI